MASASPRIAEARSRAATVKRAVAVGSLASFLALFMLARAAHPGHTTASKPAGTGVVPATGESDENEGTFGFGSGSIAPSQGVAPSVQTQTS